MVGVSTFYGSLWGKSAYPDAEPAIEEVITPPPQTEDAYAMLGELIQKSPQMAAFIQQRATATRPLVRQAPAYKTRGFSFDFSISGRKGDTVNVVRDPNILFRIDRLMAVDNSSSPGLGTRIKMIIIGNRIQYRAESGGCFSAQLDEISRNMKFDVCQLGLSIAVSVEFLKDCDWSMTAFGKGIA